jgi:hypothetical protein
MLPAMMVEVDQLARPSDEAKGGLLDRGESARERQDAAVVIAVHLRVEQRGA